MRALAVIGVCMMAAFPAFAGDKALSRPRLVTGSVELMRPAVETRAELFATGGFSLGALTTAPPADARTEAMALGGYAAYSLDALRFSSSLKGDAIGSAADFTASYAGGLMGADSVAAVTLGYEWTRHSAFSVNPMQNSLLTTESLGDLSLALSFTHSVSPFLSLGGFAAATRSEEDDRAATSGFRLGAGLGVRF